jgi:transposase
MPTKFRLYQPDQSFLLPPSPRDWLPEDHLAYFISDAVDALDLSAFYRRYEGDGRRNQPFDPRMMVKVLLYGYATGCTSSRKLARKLEEDVAFRVLAAGNFPAHRTICDFRHDHLEELRGLFVQVVKLAREAGLVKVGVVAVDGSKVKANASRHKSMSYKEMKKQERRLKQQIDRLLAEAEEIDAHEDGLYGPDKRGDELPEGLRRREDRLRTIQEAKERLEARQAEEDRRKGRSPDDERKSPRGGRRFAREFGVPEEKAQTNFTDPQSRIMKTSRGYEQCYNAQLAVDGESHLIVATGLTQNAADNGELLGLVERVETVSGERPKKLLADAGYKSEASFEALEHAGIEAYISLGREGKDPPRAPGPDLPASQRMEQKLDTPEGRAIYRQRKGIAEPVVGWIKNVLGFRQFSLRGVGKVAAEWDLVCLAIDLRRMHRLGVCF